MSKLTKNLKLKFSRELNAVVEQFFITTLRQEILSNINTNYVQIINRHKSIGTLKGANENFEAKGRYDELLSELTNTLGELYYFNLEIDLSERKNPAISKLLYGLKWTQDDRDGRGEEFVENFMNAFESMKQLTIPSGRSKPKTELVIDYLSEVRIKNPELFLYLGIHKNTETLTADSFYKLFSRLNERKHRRERATRETKTHRDPAIVKAEYEAFILKKSVQNLKK